MTQTATNPTDARTEEAPAATRRAPHPLVMLTGLTVGLGATLLALLLVFIMPSLASGPRDLPIGVVGQSEQIAAWTDALESADAEAFAVTEVATAEELADAIRDRELAGGFVLGDGTVETHVASAGSSAISGTITAVGNALAVASGMTATVTDVVALPDDDPTGIGIGGLAFPLVFGGIVPAVAFRKVFARSLAWSIAGIVTFSVVGGMTVAAVLAFIFGSIGVTSFWPVAAAMTLGIGGLALPLAGLQEAFGAKGFTIGAMVMMFLGNPLAGIATTAAWLPAGLGAFGQLLPPGSAGTLVRATAYFDGAGGLGAAFTLGAWALAGVVLLAYASIRSRRTVTEAVPPEPAPAAPEVAPVQ